jgi:hypothetical protein
LAKDRDNPAGSLDAEDTGGLLSGFLAEEDEFDRRALWRLGSWGVGAVGAVIVAVMANQPQISGRRDQVAAADLVRQAQQIQAVAKESQNQARQLASAIDTLNSDRDRLYSRVTTLEQGLDSVTGAVARQTAPPVAPPARAAPAEAPSAQSAAPAPAVGPVATAVPVPPAPDQPAAAAKPGGTEKPTAPEKPVATDKPPAPEKPPIVASTEPNPPNAPPANQEIAKTVRNAGHAANVVQFDDGPARSGDRKADRAAGPAGKHGDGEADSGTGTSTDQRGRVGGSTKGRHSQNPVRG